MSYELPSGSYFTYQIQGTISPTNPSMDSIVAQVGQNLAPDYQIENASEEGSGFLSSISQAFSLNGIRFQASLTVLSVTDSDTDSAKADLDQAFQDVTGYPPTSSVISSINNKPVQPGQVGVSQGSPTPSTPCAGTSVLGICLGTSDTFLIFIVAIVVILVVALIISPTTPARVAASFV